MLGGKFTHFLLVVDGETFVHFNEVSDCALAERAAKFSGPLGAGILDTVHQGEVGDLVTSLRSISSTGD